MNDLLFLLTAKPYPVPLAHAHIHRCDDPLAYGRQKRIDDARAKALTAFDDTEWRHSYRLAAISGQTRANMVNHAVRLTAEGLLEERMIEQKGHQVRQWRKRNVGM